MVGTEADYPPYSYHDANGKPIGFNVELSHAIAEIMGINVEILYAPWGEVRDSLEQRKIQAIAEMYFASGSDESLACEGNRNVEETRVGLAFGTSVVSKTLDEMGSKFCDGDQKTSMATETGTSGGFLVPTEFLSLVNENSTADRSRP